MTTGDKIRRIRRKRRLTQAELAMMSGLSLSAIQGYEQGRYEPKCKSLERIAEVFKIPVEELYVTSAEHSANLAEVGTDCISRNAAIDIIEDFPHGDVWNVESMEEMIDRIKQLPSAEEESFEWCTDCKEYDQEAHCCHRWNKVIKNTLVEVERERRVTT